MVVGAQAPARVGHCQQSLLPVAAAVGKLRRPSTVDKCRMSLVVTIAKGKHPVPSRTRQLSPSAPMVVGAQAPARVGHCQQSFILSKNADPQYLTALAGWCTMYVLHDGARARRGLPRGDGQANKNSDPQQRSVWLAVADASRRFYRLESWRALAQFSQTSGTLTTEE